ncbi:hypothetical protein PROFUN_13879 [Planoprotostelium fungivorum]|uniref:Uncharacterized protein n=1 Tax=Planoprotostelium fungivorum TaxID=1890364 RepID=A0A2P6N299_9EUKA|nr:hypothetical protein PROFUN_13879 [Planoprotostelium fungivorum]
MALLRLSEFTTSDQDFLHDRSSISELPMQRIVSRPTPLKSLTLDQGLVWSQESSLDVHWRLRFDDEAGEVYKTLTQTLQYKDFTERVEKSLKRIEEGRKCLIAFIDYHRDIVSHENRKRSHRTEQCLGLVDCASTIL